MPHAGEKSSLSPAIVATDSSSLDPLGHAHQITKIKNNLLAGLTSSQLKDLVLVFKAP